MLGAAYPERNGFIRTRNRCIDHGISLNTILVHSVILKKDVCDLGEEFEYKILHFRLFTSMFQALSKSL